MVDIWDDRLGENENIFERKMTTTTSRNDNSRSTSCSSSANSDVPNGDRRTISTRRNRERNRSSTGLLERNKRHFRRSRSRSSRITRRMWNFNLRTRNVFQLFDSKISNYYLAILVLTVICGSNFAMALEELVCGGFDMRNSPSHFLQQHPPESIERLKRCTVIEGDVRYILMTNPENMTTEDFKSVSLPNVREITGSLMVFQVVGLESLGMLLPNLRIIRGNSLVFNYALVLFQNPSLKEIGLTRLTEISKGGVRIAVNGELCYASTIDWQAICRDEVAHIVVENNQDLNNCFGKCKNSSAACRTESNSAMGCWNYDNCQTRCPESCSKSKKSCNLNTEPSECCHEECAGGCSGPTDRDCYACRHVHVNGRCQRQCPPNLYMFQRRRCIDANECKKTQHVEDDHGETLFFKPLPDGTCDIKCPNGYYVDPVDPYKCMKCTSPRDCVKKCVGGSITSLNEAENYKGCNIVSTHLDINIQSGLTKNVVQKLEEYLADIREVFHYVKISFSPSFVSLSMLKSLRLIRGDQLLNNRYALSVFENQHLSQLWNFTEKLKVGAGVVQFHNNPRLCYSTIMQLVDMVGLTKNITEQDVSRFSNGNKAVCEELEISLKFISVEQEHVVLSWEEFNTSQMDHRMFLGYQLYYRQVDSENVNMFEGRDACHDSWQMQFIDPEERGALLSDFKPHTLYAFYLTTLMVNSPGAKGGISKIYYQRTKFSHPSQPRISKLESNKPSTINLEWEAPSEPNGEVTHYMISYVAKRDVLPKERNYCDEPPNYNGINDIPVGGSADGSGKKSQGPTVSPAPGSVASAGTCSAHQCCECSSASANTSSRMPDQQAVFEQKEKALFENAIHNIVFVNNRCVIRHGRQVCPPRNPLGGGGGGGADEFVLAVSGGTSSSNNKKNNAAADLAEAKQLGMAYVDAAARNDGQDDDDESELDANTTTRSSSVEANRKKRAVSEYPAGHERSKYGKGDQGTKGSLSNESNPDGGSLSINEDLELAGHFIPVVVNVTGLNFTIKNLHHFTSYEIKIWACQNVSVPENSCSRQEVLKMKRTMMLEGNDAINDTSIEIVNMTEAGSNVRTIRWDPPRSPNGLIVGFEIEYVNHGSSVKKPKKDCVNVSDYERRHGHALTDLPPGNWSVRIRCLSLAQRGPWSKEIFFLIPEPYKLPNAAVIGIAIVCSLIAIAVIVFTVICVYKRNFKKKLPEYLMNVFSANPEYISQLEVYKPDEWELRREDVELLHEIGRGSFGTVYAGIGKHIRSVCGVTFGECAVKTVSERASIYDRWHFLIEASVMKQFNTAYIVKLFGVVSEGQPALVVMEIMNKGNLKEYLRSRRPNSEENVEGLRPPTLKETLQWAGEIADGMAYLEALKFCHRDLAARNCMVTATGACKIGDFGMARDVYVKDYYRPTGKRLMPVRWMAPEALKDATFTSKSDVWSYGVVLWEMATLASQPYAGLSNEDVMRFVVDDRRVMEMPTDCPPKLYELMVQCWRYEPRERPSFADVVAVLLPDMNEQFQRVSYYCTQRGREPARSSHTAAPSSTLGGGGSNGGGGSANSSSGNGNVPLSSSPAHTGDSIDAVDPSTPLNPRGCEDGVCESSFVDLPDSDSEFHMNEPVCNNNRRISKSHSTPSWVRKPMETSSTSSQNVATNNSSGSASPSGTTIASASVSTGVIDRRSPSAVANNGALVNGHAALLA